MMMVIKRNQIIVTALVIMLAIAGYLNYTDQKENLAVNSDNVKNNSELSENLMPEDFEYEEFAGIDIFNGEISIASTNEGNIDSELTVAENQTELENISADSSELPEIAENGNNVGEAVFVNTSLDSTYFVQAKLEREQARAKQKDMLTEMINNTNLEKEQRAECANAMLDIQKRIEKETSAEAMIKSKGFDEVYVRIDDNTVDVVVNKKELTDAEKAQIEDIVVRKTGISVENIRISPLK